MQAVEAKPEVEHPPLAERADHAPQAQPSHAISTGLLATTTCAGSPGMPCPTTAGSRVAGPGSSLKEHVALVLAGTMLVVATASAQLLSGSKDDLLEPDKAFRISARALDARSVEVEFRIADGYYMYRDRFSFATESGERLAEIEIPRGTPKEDRFFGRTETFRRLVRIRVPVSPGDAARRSVKLKVTSQGCADVGVCYVPIEQSVHVRLPR
ncbi:MAG: protein-disulfide reductase DsbD N-terminal domain-containing protein [Burkholderiales bacterium]